MLFGIACAGVGAELFVRGLVGLARWARISTAIIGTTLAAFATSGPETAVAVRSSLAGRPEISLGDTLGSNVFNVALILGLALCFSGIRSPRASLRRDFPVVLLVPVAVGALGFDGRLSRLDGAVLLALFLAWLAVVLHTAARERSETTAAAGELRRSRMLAATVFGLGLLVGSAQFIVHGARGIAAAFGVPEFVIGATIVAAGTSTPELATTLISRFRGQDDIGLGTVLGSSIYNGLFILGLAATICPIQVAAGPVGLALGFGVIATLVTFPRRDNLIPRWRGVVLLALYAAYMVAVLRP